ncbi:hypothetical protein [Actinophytocola oryzae]|nr:hypothetical protein [Actinophytocola oryzae]
MGGAGTCTRPSSVNSQTTASTGIQPTGTGRRAVPGRRRFAGHTQSAW